MFLYWTSNKTYKGAFGRDDRIIQNKMSKRLYGKIMKR